MANRPLRTRRIALARHITGAPTPEDFLIEDAALPGLRENQFLARTICCSADPGTRARLSPGASYAPPLEPGDTVDGFAIGEVIESENARFAVGDIVATGLGWAEHAIFPGRGYAQKIPHRRLKLSTWIGALGVPGMTAWFGLTRVGALKAGDRVLVTSAAGAVGATAAQLARRLGASLVVGTARGADKAAWLKDTVGLDAVIDYAQAEDLTRALQAASPEGYDVLFDNVGTAMIDAALPLMRRGGRVVVSGMTADYNASPEQTPGLRNLRCFIAARLSMQGFVVSDDLRDFPAAQETMAAMIERGELAVREVRYQGLEAAPQAFIDLFGPGAFGQSAFGRRIIEIGAEPA
jgi:NADPH-dependent curcumin reductase CurA